jgi:hypothetical protein
MMETNRNTTEKRPYVRPEAELIALCMQENIATSAVIDDEFDGEDDVFE